MANRSGEPCQADEHLLRSDLAAFLASSTFTLLGAIDPVNGGAVVEANRALANWVPGPYPVDPAGALTGASLVRWRNALARLVAGSRAQVVSLRFARGGRLAGYRCFLSPGPEGRAWLVGEPRGSRDWKDGRVRRLTEARRRALALARTDHLTGLANRRQAERWLAALSLDADRRAQPLACLLVDLDRFKEINDTQGHPAGDRALREAARAMAGALRSGDRVARLGGDEFLVLLPATDMTGAFAVAGRLRAALPVAASAGLAQRRPGEAPDQFVQRADAALLRAKSAGRDRVEADP